MPLIVEQLRVHLEDAGKPILQDVSFRMEDHSLVLLIGSTGSGKTTLLRAMSGLVPLASGRILYNGDSLWKQQGKINRDVLLRHAIAFQFPEHQLFASTIQGEFAYSLKPYRLQKQERTSRIIEAMQDMKLSAMPFDAFPLALSGGQKRRVALATALSAPSPWLLLDEPSAGLDGSSLQQLKERLLLWKQTRSIVMATHDWETFLPLADRVLVMAEGRLIANLNPDTLLEQPEYLQQAGVGRPASLVASDALKQAGILDTSKACTPEELADLLIEAGSRYRSARPESAASCERAVRHSELSGLDHSQRSTPSMANRISGFVPSGVPLQQHTVIQAETESTAIHQANKFTRMPWIYRQRAGAKWLLYTVVSIAILLQQSWLGTGIALLLAFGTLWLLNRKDARQGLRLSRPLFYFILITGAISGLQFTADEWTSMLDVEDALLTIRRMARFFAITLIGFVFTLSTSTAEMKSSLERALTWGRRFLPVDKISLAASLILRFIPLIIDEAQRFSVITAARGKKLVKPGKIRIWDIHVFVIPLLLSLFQMVEDLITAMEIKGRKHVRKGEQA